jgi:hypothetical protein
MAAARVYTGPKLRSGELGYSSGWRGATYLLATHVIEVEMDGLTPATVKKIAKYLAPLIITSQSVGASTLNEGSLHRDGADKNDVSNDDDGHPEHEEWPSHHVPVGGECCSERGDEA